MTDWQAIQAEMMAQGFRVIEDWRDTQTPKELRRCVEESQAAKETFPAFQCRLNAVIASSPDLRNAVERSRSWQSRLGSLQGERS